MGCFPRKRDNQFAVKDGGPRADDFCHLASLYYIKVVNRIIKRATFSSTFVALFYDYPLRPSLYIARSQLPFAYVYVRGSSFPFFLSLSFSPWLERSTISSRENSNSFLSINSLEEFGETTGCGFKKLI